jgi:hypothetical protein
LVRSGKGISKGNQVFSLKEKRSKEGEERRFG